MDFNAIHNQPSISAQVALRQLADSAKMLVWMTDVNNHYIYLNQSACALLQKSENFNLFEWIRFIHPDDLARVKPVFKKAKDTQGEYQVEYRIIRSDGTLRWMMGSGAPRFSDSGDFLGYIGTILDVTDRHEALERVANSEATHRLLTENSSDLISHHDPDGALLYVSPSIERVLGFKASELAGTKLYDHVHPDDVQVIQEEILRQVKRGAKSRLIEFRKRHKNGHYVWLGTKARTLTDPVSQEKIGIVAVSRDVTFERAAKEKLGKSEARFRSLTNLSADWYWETDEHDRFTFISDGAQRLFGTTPEHILGKTRADLAATLHQPGLLECFAKVAKREAFKNIQYATNWTAKGVMRHTNISGEPVFENGVFTGYRGVGRDITEEMEAAETLTQLAAENKALIENSLDIMMLLDQEGKILRANAAVREIIGYQPEELLGRRYLEFVVPDELEKTVAIDAHLRKGKHTLQDFDNRWIRKDGSIVHLSWSVRWSDDMRRMYASARDTTERYRTRDELHRSNERLYSMLENIGDAFFAIDHDWRITYANRKTAEFVGRAQNALTDKIIWEAIPEILTSSAFSHYQKAMQTRTASFFETYYEPARAWVEVRAYPYEDGLSVYFHDITARRETESAIRNSEQRVREVIEMTPSGYVLTDAQATLLDVNQAFCRISGYTYNELVGRSMGHLFPVCPCEGALSVQGGITSVHGKEAVIKHKDGHLVYVLVNATIKRDSEGRGLALTVFLTDITERKQAEARLEQLATHDTLTGLPNRALLNDRLQHMLDCAPSNEAVAVMFIDLDRFKEVNDSMGHEPGDILLREVARRLQKNLRPNDIVARLGGDEFVVAAYCSKGVDSAATIAEKLFSSLAAPVDIAGQEVFVGVSIGISMFPQDGQTKELLFQNADTAMYRAKAAGRNCYRFFEAEMSVQAKTRMALEHSLRRALERDEFELHYQPRIDLKTMSIVGMEALLRWNHPQLGSVPPLEFISIAEERGFIEAIGQWVLQQACRQTRSVIDKFGRSLRVSVNLSARQLKSHHLLKQVQAALTAADLPPHLLELELTESALIEDMETSVGIFKELKQLGVLLSVDDFGTGYSGLAYLRRFALDTLKLDRSFVSQEADGISNFKFIKAFVDLAHTLNLSVVAEGVETKETLQMLRETACDEAQGYLLAKPLSFAELDLFLSRLPALETKAQVA